MIPCDLMKPDFEILFFPEFFGNFYARYRDISLQNQNGGFRDLPVLRILISIDFQAIFGHISICSLRHYSATGEYFSVL